MSIATAEPQGQPVTQARVTVEVLIYAGLVALGGTLRFAGLGAAPLLPVELESVYPAWLHAAGQSQGAAAGVSVPLLYSLQVALFWLVGGSDTWARVLPAVAGTALVGLPWLLRARFGRAMTLFLVFLIAVDPWLIFFSRTADGVIFGVFFALLVMVALERARFAGTQDAGANGDRRWMWLAAVATGLLLISGPTAWSFVPLLGLNLLALGLPPALKAPARDRQALGLLGLLAGAAALLGSTIWLAYPSGLGHVPASFGRWLVSVYPLAEGEYSMGWLSIRLLAEAPLIVLFGFTGLVLLWRRQSEQARTDLYFLIVWFLWGLLLLLLPGRGPATLPVVQIPLLVAAAFALARWIGRIPRSLTSGEFWIALSVVAAFLFSIFLWARILLVPATFELNTMLIIVLLLLAAGIVLLSYGLWTDWRCAIWLLGLLLVGSLLVASARSTWRLNFQHLPTRPDGFYRVTTHPDVRNLAADLATVSAQRTGDPGELPLQVQEGGEHEPLLGWYLRGMRRMDWVLAPGGADDPNAPAYVTNTGGSVPAVAGYLGSEYALTVTWLPDALLAFPGFAPPDDAAADRNDSLDRMNWLWSETVRPLLRWTLYREVGTGVQSDGVTLWVDAGH